jgi:hypothetical protein
MASLFVLCAVFIAFIFAGRTLVVLSPECIPQERYIVIYPPKAGDYMLQVPAPCAPHFWSHRCCSALSGLMAVLSCTSPASMRLSYGFFFLRLLLSCHVSLPCHLLYCFLLRRYSLILARCVFSSIVASSFLCSNRYRVAARGADLPKDHKVFPVYDRNWLSSRLELVEPRLSPITHSPVTFRLRHSKGDRSISSCLSRFFFFFLAL